MTADLTEEERPICDYCGGYIDEPVVSDDGDFDTVDGVTRVGF